MASTTSRIRPRIFVAVTAVVVALLAAVLVPVTASALPVALSGTVVGPTGKAVASLSVSVVRLTDEAIVATTKTSSSGTFLFAALAPNPLYTLKFAKTSTTYAQYLGATSSIDDATVVDLVDAGGNSRYIRVALSASGALSGTVKKSTGAAVSGYQVRAYSLIGHDWSVVSTTTTNSSGAYTLASLEPGSYRLEARSTSSSPSYPPIFSGGQRQLSTAFDVLVVAGTTQSKNNFVLAGTGKVTGKVTGDFGGTAAEPLAGVRVTPVRWLYEGDDYSPVEHMNDFARTTNSSGSYSLSGLLPGRYTLLFEPRTSAPLPPSGTVYETVYLGDGGAADTASYFTVESGKTAGSKNIQLVQSGGLEGTITSLGDSSQLADLRVELTASGSDAGYQAPRVTHTDSHGHYEFTGLTTGLHYSITIGSFTDAPGDSVVENTYWARKMVGITVATVGVPTELNAQLSPRQWVDTTTPASIEAPWGWKVGEPLWGHSGEWTDSGEASNFSYQWYRNGREITGATDSTYLPGPNDYQEYISLVVTKHDFAWGSGTSHVGGNEIGLGTQLENPGGVHLAGGAVVGGTVWLNLGSWRSYYFGDVSPAWDIAWYVGEGPGHPKTYVGTGSTHVITGAELDLGSVIWVEAAGIVQGFPEINAVSDMSLMGEAEFYQIAAPSVTKSATAFTLKPGTWGPTPELYETEWRVYETDGSYTPTTGGLTFPTAGTAGKYVSVELTPKAYHVSGGSVLLTAQKGAPFTVSGSTALAGTPVVDGGLSWPGLIWSPSPEGYTYTWQYLSGETWKKITGPTGGAWAPTAAFLGKKVRLGITVNKVGYPDTTKYSSSVTIGAGAAPVITVAPSTNTPAAINTTVSVGTGTWDLTPDSFSYQWKYSVSDVGGGPYTTITGATSSSFAVPGSLETKFLWVDVTAKKAGHTKGIYTVPAGLVLGGSLKNLTLPKVTKSATGILSVSNGTWAPTPDSYDISWRQEDASGVQTEVGTGSTFDASLIDWPIHMRMTAKAASYNDTTVQFLAKPGTILPNGTAEIFAEYGKVGTDFTANPELALLRGPTSVNLATQWQYENSSGDWVNISGVTNTTFTPSATYLGKDLRARFTRTAANWTTKVTYSLPKHVSMGSAPIPGDAPELVGSPHIGAPIAVAPIVWNLTGVTTSYKWQTRAFGDPSWTTITDATKSTFTPGVSLWNKELRAVVTGTKSGHTSASYSAEASAPVGDGQMVNMTAPTVTKSGNVLTASAGTWNASPASVDYLWERWEQGISAFVQIGTTKSLTLTASETGKPIQLTVAAHRAHYTYGYTEAIVRKGTAPTPVDPVELTANTGTVGEVFAVTSGAWSDPWITPTYAWYRDGVLIPGATGSSYTGVEADIGKTVKVKVTAGGALYSTTTITLTVGVITIPSSPQVTWSPIIETPGGQGVPPKVGDTVSLTKGEWDLTDLKYFFEWRRDGQLIAGANSQSYTLTAADEGAFLTGAVTAAKKNYFAAGWAPAAGYTVERGDAPELISPTPFHVNGAIGSGVLGTVHKAATLKFDVPVTVTYRWFYIPEGTNNYYLITGAHSTSLTPTAGMPTDGPAVAAGGRIVLYVLATRPGHAEFNEGSNMFELTGP